MDADVGIKDFISVSHALHWVYATILLLILFTLPSRAAVSVNLSLDDPDYALFEKLANRGLTFHNAITIKPITRLYAARLLAESLRQRRHEWQVSKRQDLFLDQTLQHLAERFKRELRELGEFYQPRRPGPVFWSPLHEVKLDVIAAHEPFLHRAQRGAGHLQGVFRLQEGFVPGDDVTARLRTLSWGTFRHYLAVSVEPELIARSDPLRQEDHFDVALHKGYLKIGLANLELTAGRDTLWWGPAAFGDLALSNNAPPFDLLKLSHSLPFRLPGLFRHLGAWHIAAFAAYLDRDNANPHAVIGGLRVTLQPLSYLQIGYTHLEPFGDRNEAAGTEPDAHDHASNGFSAFDLVMSLPLLRTSTFLHGLKLYWQHGYPHRHRGRGVLSGANIIGGLIDGGRWDLQFEYAETHTGSEAGGLAFQGFFIGHPIGHAAEGYSARLRYYFTPSHWLAADGHYERYGGRTGTGVTVQERIGVEMSYALRLKKRVWRVGGRLAYARLEALSSGPQQALFFYLKVSVHRK